MAEMDYSKNSPFSYKEGLYFNSTIPSAPAYNLTDSTKSKFRKALSKVNAGTGNAKVLLAGDSTTWGLLSGGPNAAPSKLLSSLLDKYYLNSQYTFIVPPGSNSPTSGGDLDLRIGTGGSGLMSGGWGYTTWGLGNSGCWQHSGATTSTALEIRPGIDCDTFDIYYLKNGGLGSLDISVDGGTITTVSCVGSMGWAKATVTAPAASNHVLSIVKSVNTVFIFGVNAYSSTKRSIQIMNAGLCSSKTSDWSNSSAGHSIDGIPFLAPDLTFIQLGVNDAALSSVSPVTWEANLRSIIAAAKQTGDVVLSSVVPSDPAYQSGNVITLETAYQARLATIAAETDCMYVDILSRFESWTKASSMGFIADTLHLSAAGSADVASAYRKLIEAI